MGVSFGPNAMFWGSVLEHIAGRVDMHSSGSSAGWSPWPRTVFHEQKTSFLMWTLNEAFLCTGFRTPSTRPSLRITKGFLGPMPPDCRILDHKFEGPELASAHLKPMVLSVAGMSAGCFRSKIVP